MSTFNTDYLNPDSLYNVWYELDEPILVLFHDSKSQLCKDFQRIVFETISESINLKNLKLLQVECSEDKESLPQDYKIFRLPCLIRYDYGEKGRINSMVPTKDLREWMENE